MIIKDEKRSFMTEPRFSTERKDHAPAETGRYRAEESSAYLAG
jgi:hypothetical protein